MADWNAWMEKTVNLTRAGISKAKDLGEIARLNLDNLSEEERIKQTYIEIGEQYVAQHLNAPEAGYETMFQKLEQAKANIRSNKEKIANLKREANISDEDVESMESAALEEKEAVKIEHLSEDK